MQRTTNRSLLDGWIHRNGPNGIAKLIVESGVSETTVKQARFSPPKKQSTRLALCKALGVEEDELFPCLPTGEAAS
jgi:hypothetical protein